MATVEAKSATLVAVVVATAGPVVAQVGFLAWGALVGGIMAVAMQREPVSVRRGAGLVTLGMLAALIFGGLAASVLPQLGWASAFGLSSEELWAPVGLFIGAFWQPAWKYAERKISSKGDKR